MVDAEIGGDHVITRRAMRSLPLDESRPAAPQPIYGAAKRAPVVERARERGGVLRLRVCVDDAVPYRAGNVVQLRRRARNRGRQVRAQHAEGGCDFGDLGEFAGHRFMGGPSLCRGPSATRGPAARRGAARDERSRHR